MTTLSLSLALLRGGKISVPAVTGSGSIAPIADRQTREIGTLLSNMASYGFAPTAAVLSALSKSSQAELAGFWANLEPALAAFTGADRNMSDAIVYKNFPREVLEMDLATYWVQQIMMYLGFPAELLTTPAEDRPLLAEITALRVLDAASCTPFSDRLEELTRRTATWTDLEAQDAVLLAMETQAKGVDYRAFPSKANAASLSGALVQKQPELQIAFSSPTDMLRHLAVLAGTSPRLDAPFRMPSLKRAQRKAMIATLDAWASEQLSEDFAARPGLWRQFLMRLHPGDYAAPNLNAAYDLLYRGEVYSFEERLTRLAKAKDPAALSLASTRPGVFARRLRHLNAVFGTAAIDAFLPYLGDLSTLQLLRLSRIFETLETRKFRLYAPKGNLARAKALAAPTATMPQADIKKLRAAIAEELSARMDVQLPEGVDLDAEVENVRIAMNGQGLAPHGRGTRFPIPREVTFLRSMSWWKAKTPHETVWFDNGWNFFRGDWSSVGVLSYDSTTFNTPSRDVAAVFSGDPVSAGTQGVGAQAIDLYLDKLEMAGVRYAAWNILCYSHQSFAEASEVFACLQWGEDAEAGEIFEPARAKMAFPLTQDSMSNVIALLDLQTRELVYLDAPLPLAVSSATRNTKRLETLLPALLEVTEAQPSIADLFAHARPGTVPVRYTDKGAPVSGKAFVFARENTESAIDPLDIEGILAAAG